MSDEIRVNRPVSSQPSIKQEQPAGEMRAQKSSSKLPWIILGVIVVALVVVGVLFRDKLPGGSGNASEDVKYQAVFLTNGQVYFGKLSDADKDYITLTDIYYLQVVQPALQGQQTAQPTTTQGSDEQPQISLVKLGNELHGPVDEMHISRAQVLFYEDLKNDGKVAEAIDSYKANPQGSNTMPSK